MTTHISEVDIIITTVVVLTIPSWDFRFVHSVAETEDSSFRDQTTINEINLVNPSLPENLH